MITSLQNPKVKQVVKLRQRRERDTTGLFLIEGYRELSRAGDEKIESLFFCEELFLGINEMQLIRDIEARGATIFPTTKSVFEKLSYRDRPDGLIGVAKQQRKKLTDLKLGQTPFLLVAESIEKPGNLGTMLRSADAVGIDGVIVCDPQTDMFNPNVVRASVGTLFTVPVIQTTIDELLGFLKERGISLVATTPSAKAAYTKTDLSGPVAIAAGTEQLGLTDRMLKAADIKVQIPMRGVADSLNVASATTLVLYEVLRQRG